jgi:transcriptional regulator with XRE-family HTH domain
MEKTFAKIIKRIMRERNLSQTALANILGIAQSQVSNRLSGKHEPKYSTLRLLISELDLSADELL